MKRSSPPPCPRPEPWRWVIEPVDDMLPFGRWRIYLTNGWVRYGSDGWGWLRWSYRAARRKAERELRRKVRKDRSLELRTALAQACQ